jgi:hypothetical protein
VAFDLIEFARKHRYRVRNLHDGRPLHPLRVPVTGRDRVAGYVGDADRMDAIIGRYGYVCDDGDGRIGWYVYAGSAKGIKRWLPKLVAAGAVVRQEGTTEVAEDAPTERIDAVLRVLRPYRKQLGNAGSIRPGSRTGARIAANARGLKYPRNRNRGWNPPC